MSTHRHKGGYKKYGNLYSIGAVVCIDSRVIESFSFWLSLNAFNCMRRCHAYISDRLTSNAFFVNCTVFHDKYERKKDSDPRLTLKRALASRIPSIYDTINKCSTELLCVIRIPKKTLFSNFLDRARCKISFFVQSLQNLKFHYWFAVSTFSGLVPDSMPILWIPMEKHAKHFLAIYDAVSALFIFMLDRVAGSE